MSAPLPPGINAGAPAAPAPAGGGAPVPLGDVLIRALPERLSGLDRAVSISGTVVAQEDGAATIRTAAGDVTVETPAPLPTDRPVTLRIPPQVPGAPPRAQASAPPAPQIPTPATDGPAQTAAPAATAALTPPPLPSIQPGATIIAMVVAALQPRPPAPPAPGTPGSTDGDDVPAGPPLSDEGATGSAPAPGPARPATSPPASSTLPAASPPGGRQTAGGPDPLTNLPGGSGGDDSASTTPSAGATSRPSPPEETKASPAAVGEPARPATPSRPVDPAADAVRLARLARYNIATEAPSSGLLSLQEFGSKAAPAPLTEARLRGGTPTVPPTTPPTAPSTVPSTSSAPATPPPSPPRPGSTQPAAGPPVPAGAAAPAVDPDTLIMARLRGGAPPSPPTSAPTVPTPPPAPGPSAPQIVPTGLPVEMARLRSTSPQGGEPTAPPTGPAAPPATNPSHPGKPPAAAGTSPEPAVQLARLREGPTVSPPPTAPPTISTPGRPPPQPAVPQQTPPAVPAADAPVMLARLREGVPPTKPSAPPTVGTPSVEPKTPPVPHRQGAMSAALAAQEAAPTTQLARLRDATLPAPATAPATSPAAAPPPRGPVPSDAPAGTIPTIPAPTNPLPVQKGGGQPSAAPLPAPAATGAAPLAGPDGRPQQPSVSSPAPATPDDALLQARLRDGQPPPPATAPTTIPAPPAPGPRPGVPAPRQQPDSPTQVAQVDAEEPSAVPRDVTGQPTSRAPADAPPARPVPDRPPLPHGQPVRLRVLALDAAPGNAGSSQTVTGTLVGSTAQGQPVVTTPLGTLVLRARTDLPAGTTLALAVDIPPTPKAAMLPPLDPAQGLDWPALREVMATLAAADPLLAKTIAASILPQPNKRLTTNLTFFLSALRGGDAAGWLGGPAAELLEMRGGSKLLAQLRDDFRAAQQAAAEPTPDGWRAMPIPFGTPEQLMRAQLHVKNAGEQEKDDGQEGEKQGPAKRFLLDLNFSRIGPMQFDGMVRPGRFDLMVRTQNLLPAEVRQRIGTIFRDSLETVGYSGAIAFQTGAHLWARVQSAPRGPGVRA